MPFEGMLERKHFQTVFADATQFPELEIKRCNTMKCREYGRLDLREELQRNLKSFEEKIGLCLDCVIHGPKSKLEGRCRVYHH